MSFQVLRIETYKKTSLRGLGGETERDGREKAPHKNADIVKSLSYKNMFLKKSTQGFHKEWQRVMDEMHAQSRVNKKTNVLDGMIITSDKAFFEKLGWKKGKAPTLKMKEFFDEAYAWALKEIGFMGTDKNVISAVIHVDEETPHLHLYYLPVTEKWREKQYARDENGKILRNGKNPVYLRGEDGEIIYAEKTDEEKPRLNRDEFWRIRGGVDSYALMQDRFFDEVAKKWGLERGEKGSRRKHTSKQEYEKAQAATVAHSVEYIDLIKPRQTLLNRITGEVTVDKDDFEDLKRQAVAYARKQPQLEQATEKERTAISRENEAWKGIIENRDKKDELDRREREIKSKENDLEDEKEHLQQELKKLGDLPDQLKNTQEKLRTTQQELKTYQEYATRLYRENQKIDKIAEVKAVEETYKNQIRKKDKEHTDEVNELKDQISDLKNSLDAGQQDHKKELDKERKKREELEKKHKEELEKQKEDYSRVIAAKDVVIKSLTTAIRSMGWVLTTILGWIQGNHHDYAAAAIRVGNDSLANSGQTPDICFGMEKPEILEHTVRNISDDSYLGL